VNSILLYTVPHKEALGHLFALYVFFTGLSAGSFFVSTLAYGFGQKQYRELSRPAIIVATLMLLIAPLFLLVHLGQPFRFWHLGLYFNLRSPITWGSFLLTTYPLFCLIYMYCIFKEMDIAARRWGLVGIPFAVAVHAYTGLILSFCHARPLWHSSMIPLLFLVSAVVSGTALMILVFFIWVRWKKEDCSTASENGRLLLSLGKILGWVLVLDIVMTAMEILSASVSGADTRRAVKELLTGELAFYFLGIEILLGKFVPLVLIFHPRFKRVWILLLACILIVIGILYMRLDLVHVGELIPLI